MLPIFILMASCSQNIETNVIFQDPKVTELADAACRGDSTGVKRLIDAGVSPRSQGRMGISPLEVAISCKSKIGIVELIAGGASVNREIEKIYSPFILAARSGNVDSVSILIKNGADIYYVPENARHSAFGDAFDVGFEEGNWSVFEFLLENGIDVNKPINRVGNVDIATYAASLRRYDKVIYLIDLGYRRDLDKVLRYAEVDRAESAGGASYRDEVIEKIKKIKEGRR